MSHVFLSRIITSFFALLQSCYFSFFFFNVTATTEIYTLSLHDALPIWPFCPLRPRWTTSRRRPLAGQTRPDRKSTRLNSSHRCISYAVFCLKKKKNLATHRAYYKRKTPIHVSSKQHKQPRTHNNDRQWN